jgi:hypothetical protein
MRSGLTAIGKSMLYRSRQNCHAVLCVVGCHNTPRNEAIKESDVMTARAAEIDGLSRQNDFRGGIPESSASTLTRYRLDVIASSVGDVVQSAGGWLFDRAMAGWDVNLHIAGSADARPLVILGVDAHPLDETLGSPAAWPSGHSIAVAADVFKTDARVRKNAAKALERGLAEVTLWGDTLPPEFNRRAEAVQHRLSAAARAFKAQALTAAALPSGSIALTETFRTSRRHPPYEPDLIPLG